MTTVLDVARHAGVSSATVSRVLNGNATVNLESRERVRAAIAELGFSPNPMAQGLRRGQSNTIALLVGDIAQTHFAELTMQLQACLESKGFDLLLFNLGHSANRLAEFLSRAATMRLRGVMIALSDQLAPSSKPLFASLLAAGLRVVAIGQDLTRLGIASIIHEERVAAAQSVRYLIGRGHQRIAYIGRIKGSSVGTERFRGYRDALEAAGFFHPALVWDESFRYAAGERAVNRALDESLRFSAIQAASDEIALGALAALRDRGLSVPGDVAIVGFGGIQMGAFLRPALTTLSSHPDQAAVHVGTLFEGDGARGPATLIRLPRTLVVRESA